MSNTVLRIENLTKKFDDAAANEAPILEGLNLEVESGEFLSVLGPSGCGKTTMLRCVAGFEKFEGRVEINGIKRSTPGTDRIMVFQDFNQLFPWKTVEKNIQYPLVKSGIKDKKVLKQITAEVLAKVKLSGYEKHYPHQLSGGMKQRVAIAKALALKPQIILMDEPFAALDAMTRNRLQAVLLDIWSQTGCTIVFITHNIQEAIVLGTRIIVMKPGGVIAVDEKNPLPAPKSPASEGYAALWDRLRNTLYEN